MPPNDIDIKLRLAVEVTEADNQRHFIGLRLGSPMHQTRETKAKALVESQRADRSTKFRYANQIGAVNN